MTDTFEADGRRVVLSNLDKTLWPEAGFTKGDLIAYYVATAPALVPHVSGRALTLRRFPDGVEAASWYQTLCRGHPAWLATKLVPGRDGAVYRMCVVDDLPSLVWVANLGTIELHPFLARGDDLDRPTAVVFDLDP